MPAMSETYYRKVEDYYRRRQRQVEHEIIRKLSLKLRYRIGAEAHDAFIEALPDNIGYREIVERLEAEIAKNETLC